jgi:hypothetical protein
MAQAITTSNFLRLASFSMASRPGRLSRALAPLMPGLPLLEAEIPSVPGPVFQRVFCIGAWPRRPAPGVELPAEAQRQSGPAGRWRWRWKAPRIALVIVTHITAEWRRVSYLTCCRLHKGERS